ncbi:DUF6602 domain-containing protein [Aeromonas veronii]
MKIKPYVFDLVVDMEEDWNSISLYEVDDINDGLYTISAIKDKINKNEGRVIPDNGRLLVYPLSILHQEYFECASWMLSVGDLIFALLNKNKSLSLHDLSERVLESYKPEIKAVQIDWILRCLTAAHLIVAKSKNSVIEFSLSPSQIKRERERWFAATIANELSTLSDRVKNIINHGPTVGTYRENILRDLLKKNLPERYHTATGFIFGLEKQIDILIYDRIDYAPIFREGDLVIVPPESVRAAIEVKTNLTSDTLESALDLLHAVSSCDDKKPPFFKGIYAFGSSFNTESLYEKIAMYYTDYDRQAQGGPGQMICRPFQHFTCVCVDKKNFAFVDYIFNDNKRLVPMLFSKESITGLNSQSSFFMQSLLSYLKYGGMKSLKNNYLAMMLGEDVSVRTIKDLRGGDDSWAAYFSLDEGDGTEADVYKMENDIISVKNWLNNKDSH